MNQKEQKLHDSVRPKYFSEPLGAEVRIRLVEIENMIQPGSRSRNSVHIELYDRFKFGNLDRSEIDLILTDSPTNYEKGIFLCNRNIKNIQLFHSELKYPTCKRCASIASRLIKKGVKFSILSEKLWNFIQDTNEEIMVLQMLDGLTDLKIGKR